MQTDLRLRDHSRATERMYLSQADRSVGHEAIHLAPEDIDGGNMLMHRRYGKG